MSKVLIAVPCMDSLPSLFAHSLAYLRKVGECSLAFEIGSLIYTSRNNLAKKAVEMDADYIMWFDSDMVFQPDTMEKLFQCMEETGADIISGLYFRRVPPFTPVIFDRIEMAKQDGLDICLWSEFDEIPSEPFEVGACGFGCVLMKTDVIFDVQGRFGNLFQPIANCGEDIAFCWRSRECGHKIVCDPSIELGHIGSLTTNREFFENYKQQKGDKDA